MTELLEKRYALVTGAGSGIGKATAVKLARDGTSVALIGRTGSELRATARTIRSMGAEALELLADISSPDSMRRAFRKIERAWERLDIVVANAGINGVWAPFEEIAPKEWDQTFSINVRGTFLTLRHAIPLLKKGRKGSIVLIASVNGTRMFSNTGATAYACSKAAQVAMAKMLAVEMGPSNIRVNVICPGAIETEISDNTKARNTASVKIPVQFPKGAIPLTGQTPGKAEQVADLVSFLASDDAAHISGTEVYIDGAQSLLQG